MKRIEKRQHEIIGKAAAFPIISIMIVLPCRKLWCSKCWNQLAGNFDVYLHAKKSASFLTSFLSCCKEIPNLLFWELWNIRPSSSKITVSICRKLPCLSACKKPTSSLTYFKRYCKEVSNSVAFILWIPPRVSRLRRVTSTFVLKVYWFFCPSRRFSAYNFIYNNAASDILSGI